MDNSKNNSWDEISDDISDVTKKIKDKVSQENLVDDLKDSFRTEPRTHPYTGKSLQGFYLENPNYVKEHYVKNVHQHWILPVRTFYETFCKEEFVKGLSCPIHKHEEDLESNIFNPSFN